MKRKILVSLLLISFIVAAFSSVPVQATNGTTVVLGLCIDGSGSIGSSDFSTMINGIAQGIRNNLAHDGTVELFVMQFANNGPAVVEVPPTIITASNFEAVATAVEGITQLYEMTSMADGLWLTWDTMKTASTFATSDKQIINLATDGYPNEDLSLAPGTTGDAADDVELVVGWAVAEGLDELDAEAITSGADVAWLRDDIVYPQPGYEAPPFAGPGWVQYCDTFQDFADAIAAKFERIEEKDIVAVSQSVTELEVMPGDIVDIDVTVQNDGDDTETFEVTCTADGFTIGTILVVDLAPGETRTMTFTWDTTGVPQGTYSIVALADSSDMITEVDETNNVCQMPCDIFVVPELPLGTIIASLGMFGSLVGYVGFKRRRTK